MNGGAVLSVDGGVGVDDGFSPRDEVGRAEDVGRAGNVVLRGGPNVVRLGC